MQQQYGYDMENAQKRLKQEMLIARTPMGMAGPTTEQLYRCLNEVDIFQEAAMKRMELMNADLQWAIEEIKRLKTR